MPEDVHLDEWESVADAWETNRARIFDFFRPVSDWLIAAVDPQPGQTVLEVAAGPGETGFLVAERVGAHGRVLSTDFAPTMVAAARRGAEARGLANVECLIMDAQSLDLDADSVDSAVSRLGLMLVPKPSAAFAELRRVIRPDGALAYAVIGAPDQNQWLSSLMGSLLQNGHAPASGDPFALGGPFGLASPDTNVDMLRDAGFTDIEVEVIHGAMVVADVDDYWETQTRLAGPVKETVDRLDDDERARVQETLADMVAPFQGDEGLALPSQLVAVRAA